VFGEAHNKLEKGTNLVPVDRTTTSTTMSQQR
jgi:hypothetical protein